MWLESDNLMQSTEKKRLWELHHVIGGRVADL